MQIRHIFTSRRIMKQRQSNTESKASRIRTTRVALGAIIAFWAIYGATSLWRPVQPEAVNCTACCMLPEPSNELRPVPLSEDEFVPRENQSGGFPDRAFVEDAVSQSPNCPTLAPPAARGNVVYGPAIEVLVEANQVGDNQN